MLLGTRTWLDVAVYADEKVEVAVDVPLLADFQVIAEPELLVDVRVLLVRVILLKVDVYVCVELGSELELLLVEVTSLEVVVGAVLVRAVSPEKEVEVMLELLRNVRVDMANKSELEVEVGSELDLRGDGLLLVRITWWEVEVDVVLDPLVDTVDVEVLDLATGLEMEVDV